MKNQTTALPAVYTITAGDLGSIFASSGVRSNGLSPYPQMVAESDKTSSVELQRLMASPDGPIITRLLRPPTCGSAAMLAVAWRRKKSIICYCQPVPVR